MKRKYRNTCKIQKCTKYRFYFVNMIHYFMYFCCENKTDKPLNQCGICSGGFTHNQSKKTAEDLNTGGTWKMQNLGGAPGPAKKKKRRWRRKDDGSRMRTWHSVGTVRGLVGGWHISHPSSNPLGVWNRGARPPRWLTGSILTCRSSFFDAG